MKDQNNNTVTIAGVPFNITGVVCTAIVLLIFINAFIINWITDSQRVIEILMK